MLSLIDYKLRRFKFWRKFRGVPEKNLTIAHITRTALMVLEGDLTMRDMALDQYREAWRQRYSGQGNK